MSDMTMTLQHDCKQHYSKMTRREKQCSTAFVDYVLDPPLVDKSFWAIFNTAYHHGGDHNP